MQITIRLLASYRSYLPDDHDEHAGYRYEAPPQSSVADILDRLPLPTGDPYTFFVNGRHAQREQVLEPDDVLSVFPAVGGG